MLDVKQAAKAATDYFEMLYDAGQYLGLLLEEVDRSPDERLWYITLGFYDAPTEGPLAGFGRAVRRYKVFSIDDETGRVVSMKIREFASSELI